jgi:hypothetical protein
VDLTRQSANPSASSKLDLAEALNQLGSFQFASAQFAQGSEKTNTFRAAEQSYAEARRILTALQQSGTLPETSRGILGDASNSLATIAARLAETNIANR